MLPSMKPSARVLILSLIFGVTTLAAEPSPEVRAWAAGCRQPPPALYTGAADRVVERMKAEKLWDKCGLLLFFAAHDASPGAFHLKGCPRGELLGGTHH